MASNEGFQIIIGGLISSTSTDYEVQDLLGYGTFGVVTQCRKLVTNETVALKILRDKRCIEDAKEEAVILKIMKMLNSENFNIVRWNDSFTYEGRYCLEFEKLDISLHEFLQRSQNQSLALKEIRPIVQQLATALEFLKSIGLIHADLKPLNIMMVDHLQQPLKVKVIDFGLACSNPRAWMGATLQTQWYRSPEIILGASFNEAIDIWSLGCTAAEMFMGTILFPGTDEYDMMRHIFYTIGKPPDHLLNAGLYAEQFFRAKYRVLEDTVWRFISTLEIRHFTCTPRTINSLSDLMKVPCKLSGDDARADECDRASFVDLLVQMLKVDASERITPSQILQHPFITMSNLVGTFNNNFHVKLCIELMSICQGLTSDNGETSNSTASPANHSVPSENHSLGMSSKEQPFLQSTIISRENSTAKKRKRASADYTECRYKRLNPLFVRSPDTIVAKKRRSECLDGVPTETGVENSPRKSLLHKRKRGDANLKKILCNSEGAQSCLTQVNHHRKRKRGHEEASGSDKTSPVKRRRRSLDGEV